MAVWMYQRVSTDRQELARQEELASSLGIAASNVYAEKITGVAKQKPQLEALLEKVSEGDVIHVCELNRFSRDIWQLLGLLAELHEAGITVVSHNPDITITAGESDLNQTLIALVCAWQGAKEYQDIHTRQKEGIAAAKAHGKTGGRPKWCEAHPEATEKAIEAYLTKSNSVREITRIYGITAPTLYAELDRRGLR